MRAAATPSKLYYLVHYADKMDALPVQAFKRRDLRRTQPDHALLGLRPTELARLQTTDREDHSASIPDQELHPINALRAEHVVSTAP